MMFPLLWDWTFVLLIPAALFAGWASLKVRSTYAHYAQKGTRSGMTGRQVADAILRDAGVSVTGIERIPGEMSDHYDPRTRTLRLSEAVYGGRSIAALGIAAHEVGHAIQHARGYAPMSLRSAVYPLSSLGSSLSFPLFFIGFLFGSETGALMMNAGILLFSLAVAFTLVTLPVEFNASSRALKALSSGGYLQTDEMKGARKVLSAAAMTYVASAAMALMQLLRLILLAQRRD
jgi:hypothetical protein